MARAYEDGEAVELFDEVEVRIEGETFEAYVVRLGESRTRIGLRVRDHRRSSKATGEPVVIARTVPVGDVVLIRRAQ